MPETRLLLGEDLFQLTDEITGTIDGDRVDLLCNFLYVLHFF